MPIFVQPNSVGTFTTGALLSASPVPGTLAYVSEFKDFFSYDPSNTGTADGVTLLTTANGGNTRWVRLNIANPAWASTEAWYVDYAAGADTNAGSVGAPLKTWAELNRRLGKNTLRAPNTGTVVCNIVTDAPTTDPIMVDWILGANVNLRIVGGTAVSVRTGTFTAVTGITRSTNTPQSVTDDDSDGAGVDTAANWAPNLSQRVRLTNGTHSGKEAWVAKDLGSSEARTSVFAGVGSASAFSTTVTVGAPGSTDNYTVERPVSCLFGQLRISHEEPFSSGLPQVNVENLWLTNDAFTGSLDPQCSNTVQFNFYRCRLDPFVRVFFGTVFFLNCHFGIGYKFGCPDSTFVFAGLSGSSNSFRHSVSGQVNYDFDHMIQVCGLNILNGGMVSMGTCCVFDAAANLYNPNGDGIAVGYDYKVRGGGSLAIQTQTGGSGTHAVYGSGNAGAGIRVSAGGVASYVTNVPTITGTGGDFRLADSTQGRGFDASGPAYTALINCTWTLLATAIGSAGFGDCAFNPAKGGSIVKTA